VEICARCKKGKAQTGIICQKCIDKALEDIKEVIGKRIEKIFISDGIIYVLYTNQTWEYR
jgi:hypothetical protein